jgi:hypothetical protein
MKCKSLAGLLCITSFLAPWVHAESILTVGNVKVKAGNVVTIPIDFENGDSVVGLQFDLFLPIDEIQQIDVGECFTEDFKANAISACRQQTAPNNDVIRYLLVKTDLSPLPSGHLTDLVIHTKPNAFSGRYLLSVTPSTALAPKGGGDMIPLALQDGQLEIVGGQHASAAPAEVEPILFTASIFSESLDLDPSTAASHKTVSDFELLADNPTSLSVQLPDDVVITATRKEFRADRGFVPRIGTGEPLRDPAVSANEREYFWRGSEDQTDVRFTVHDGYVRGSITAPDGAYTVAGPFGDVAVNLIDPDNLPPSDAEAFLSTEITYTVQIQDPIEPVSTYSVANVDIDVLVMFTEQARTDAGGQTGLDALIAESMNNLNSAAQDGETQGVSFNLADTQQLFGFTPTGITIGNVIDDLRSIRLDPSVRSARDSADADIVMVLLRNFFDAQNQQQLGACGVAFLQNKICAPNTDPPDSNCTVGATYEDYAYGWASVFCTTLPQRHSFPHEIGHIMGAEHHSLFSHPPSVASFPWSFGYEDRVNAIATLMWAPRVSDPETPQYIQFSNPGVLINGFVSGVDGESENASTLFRLAPVVAGFRGPASEVIFRDSFETGVP